MAHGHSENGQLDGMTMGPNIAMVRQGQDSQTDSRGQAW